MRTAYHEQLEALSNRLGEMCELAGDAMERATQALLQADLALAEQVITDHAQIAALSVRAEEEAFVLLALQAPVAGDLRAIVSSIQIVADVDRMGALALHVAKIARRRHPQHALPEEVNGYFAEMGRVAVELGNSAQEVLLTRDPEKAARIREEDDAMDDLHRHLFTVLMDREWKHGVAAAVDVTLLGPLLRALRRPRRRGRPAGDLPGHRPNPATKRSCRPRADAPDIGSTPSALRSGVIFRIGLRAPASRSGRRCSPRSPSRSGSRRSSRCRRSRRACPACRWPRG